MSDIPPIPQEMTYIEWLLLHDDKHALLVFLLDQLDSIYIRYDKHKQVIEIDVPHDPSVIVGK